MKNKLIFWLQIAAHLVVALATVGPLKGQTTPVPPQLVGDTAYYEVESGGYFELRQRAYDDGSTQSEKTYLGDTRKDMGRRAAFQNELETSALAAAVKLVASAPLILGVSADRLASASEIGDDNLSKTKALGGLAAILLPHTWTSSEGSVEFSSDGSSTLEWLIPGVRSGQCRLYGTQVVGLVDFPTEGVETVFFRLSPRKFTDITGDYTIAY